MTAASTLCPVLLVFWPILPTMGRWNCLSCEWTCPLGYGPSWTTRRDSGELGGSKPPVSQQEGPHLHGPRFRVGRWLSQTLPAPVPPRTKAVPGPGRMRGQGFSLLLTPDLCLPILYLSFENTLHYLSIEMKKAHNSSVPLW